MDLFADYTVRMVAFGSAVLGATSGVLGTFAYLRRQSLLGDAVSHAALPGIALAFMLTGTKTPLVLMLGAAVAGWLGTLVVRLVRERSRVPFDSALGIVLAVFFGFGLVLLTLIQKQPNSAQAGLESFLFGQAASLLRRDVMTMAVLGSIALAVVVLLWKEFKVLSFDPDFAASIGLPSRRLDGLLTLLLVVAIVIGLQTVGVVLMSAMIVAPAAAARQWSRRLAPMALVAAAIGVASGVAGSVASSVVPRLPTGPTIVLVLSAAVVVSLFLAPQRGLVWRWFRRGRLRQAPDLDPILMHLYALSLQHEDEPEHGHPVAVLRTMSPPEIDVQGILERLAGLGLARETGPGLWAPTSVGRREALDILEREGEAGV
ncbi:MAG: iron chelate uptake ABC transporter family permease subunit [Holophagae bacterium]|jgi:manganese/zinc/iron transport system permease protein